MPPRRASQLSVVALSSQRATAFCYGTSAAAAACGGHSLARAAADRGGAPLQTLTDPYRVTNSRTGEAHPYKHSRTRTALPTLGPGRHPAKNTRGELAVLLSPLGFAGWGGGTFPMSRVVPGDRIDRMDASGQCVLTLSVVWMDASTCQFVTPPPGTSLDPLPHPSPGPDGSPFPWPRRFTLPLAPTVHSSPGPNGTRALTEVAARRAPQLSAAASLLQPAARLSCLRQPLCCSPPRASAF